MITIRVLDIYKDNTKCLIQVSGPAQLKPALRREGYEDDDDSILSKLVVNDEDVIRDELELLHGLGISLKNSMDDHLVSQLYTGADRIKSGDDIDGVLDNLINLVRSKGMKVIG